MFTHQDFSHQKSLNVTCYQLLKLSIFQLREILTNYQLRINYSVESGMYLLLINSFAVR